MNVKGRAGPLIGVLGGMGPRATVSFLEKLIEAVPASCDQDHLPTVVYSWPQTPDRSEAILRGGPSPLPDLLKGIRALERAGAGVIAIPCNTAHFWHADLQAATPVPVLHVVDAVIADLAARGLTGEVALLATDATVEAGIYAQKLQRAGFSLFPATRLDQRAVSDAIRKVKAGDMNAAAARLGPVIAELDAGPAQACILGCTELPLIAIAPARIAFVDSTRALAKACAAYALTGALIGSMAEVRP